MRRTDVPASVGASVDSGFARASANLPSSRPAELRASALFDRAPRAVAGLAGTAGAVVLAGWVLEVPILVTWLPGLVAMRVNTAIGFILLGISLWILSGARDRTAAVIAVTCALAAAALGLSTGVEYLAGIDLHIDQLVFADRAGWTTVPTGRMSLASCGALTLIGTAIAVLPVRSRRIGGAIEALAAGAVAFAAPGLLGYTFNLAEFRDPLIYAPIALHTSLLFVLLAVAAAGWRRDSRLRLVLTSAGPGGFTARRLLPALAILAVLFGWAMHYTLRHGAVTQTTALALFATATIGLLGALVFWTALVLDRGEEARARLAALVQSSTDAIVGGDVDGTIRSWNPGAQALYGYTDHDVIGRSIRLLAFGERAGEIDALLGRVVAGERVAPSEMVMRAKDGSEVEVSIALSAIRDAAGIITGISTIARDISVRRHLERAARDAESRFRVLVDQALVGIYIIEDGRFAYVNRRMAELFGYTSDELVALPTVMAVVDPSDWDRVAAEIRHRMEGDLASHYEVRGRRKDGSALLAEIHGSVLPGAKRRLVGMLLDITAQRANQEALRNQEALLREAQAIAHVGSWELDLATNALTWSDETYRIFGLVPGAVHPSYDWFLERIHPDDRTVVSAAFTRAVATRQPYAIDHRIVLEDRTVKHVHQRCVTEYDDQHRPLRSIGAVQDVTDRTVAQQALKRLNEELEQRVEHRTAELRSANKELEAFWYSVSHDLRAPLRALQGFSRILLEEHVQELSADATRYLGIIRDSAAQMGTLVDDLLAFSRLGRQPVCGGRVDMHALVIHALDQLAGDREGRAVRVDVADLPACWGDAALLRQVVANLLSNALKFTQRRQDAAVEIRAAEDPLNPAFQAYLVRDNGAGFDMQYAGKLFGIFQRLHPAAEYPGTGVGLAIVQRIVNRHGGRVWAEAAVGRGATFYFSLPKDVGNGVEGDRDSAGRGQPERRGAHAARAREEQARQPAPRGA